MCKVVKIGEQGQPKKDAEKANNVSFSRHGNRSAYSAARGGIAPTSLPGKPRTCVRRSDRPIHPD
jgi:hypothetical protein